MKTITIAPLSTPKTRTIAAWEAILGADKLYLQTKLHPSAKPVLDAGLAFTDMDDLYDASSDFDALNAAIAKRLTSGGSCVYAVMGDGCFAQLPVLQEAAKQAGFSVVTLAGVSYAKAAFPAVQDAVTVCAHALPTQIDTRLPLCVEELDNALEAGETKLLLMEYYPSSLPVSLAVMDANGAYKLHTVSLFELDRQARWFAGTVLYVPPVSFDALTRYGVRELALVMARLRAPNGCPWDKEQTHASLKQDLIEECYELCDAIDEGDDAHIVEELGDVLLQVVFHAEIAEEQGRFTLRDVSDGIVKKLIYRHPHIFGDTTVHSSEEVLANWDALKRIEKSQATQTDVLCAVPKRFPALMRSAKVQKKARKVGFDWANAEEAFPKVTEEVQELRVAVSEQSNIAEEAGDLLFAVVNVIRLLGLDAEQTLHDATDKFIRRFGVMEQLAQSDGQSLENLTLKEQDAYWEKAKQAESSEKEPKKA